MPDGSPLTFHKVAELPPAPVPNAVYFVRPAPDSGMSIVVTTDAGEPVDISVPGASRFSETFPQSAEWIVNHNLGFKPAAVTVLNAGSVEVEANIVHTSDNQFVVSLSPPMAGQVIVQ